MRLFAAIDLDETARAAAAESGRVLATRLGRVHPPVPVRWVAPEQLHFTLRFLGEVSAGRAEALRRAVGAPWETRAFAASLAGVDVFPLSGAPRVIWLGVDKGREQMAALKTELDRRLAGVGFEPVTKPFRAHLTLGRIKRQAGTAASVPRDVLSAFRPQTARWMVERVTLYESRVSSRGATYHVAESAMLSRSCEPGQAPP